MKSDRQLVMDDEALVADPLAQILNLSRYEAQSFYTHEAVLNHISSHPCDLLITDVIVDGQMSGIDLAMEFSRLLPICKVQLMSGDTTTTDVLKNAQKSGYSFDTPGTPFQPEISERLKSLTFQFPSVKVGCSERT